MDDALQLQMIFQVLGDVNRLRILKLIGNQECSVSQIVEDTGLSQPLVSHHLRALRESMILEPKRQGPFIYYKLKDPRLLDALGLLQEIFSEGDVKWSERMFSMPSWWKNMC
jgi:DNA-binding transcriptional ArsR family regulator